MGCTFKPFRFVHQDVLIIGVRLTQTTVFASVSLHLFYLVSSKSSLPTLLLYGFKRKKNNSNVFHMCSGSLDLMIDAHTYVTLAKTQVTFRCDLQRAWMWPQRFIWSILTS